jgi:glycosyltransferase involved in cell wall biosynthesis
LRILVVSHYFWPENFRINDLVAEWVRRGHSVTVVTGLPNYPAGAVFPDYRRDPSQFMQFAGAEIVRVPMVPRGSSRLQLMLNYATAALSTALVGSWKLRGREFDAIFAYEPSPITVGIPAVLFRATKRAPLAFWVLDLWPDVLAALRIVRSPAVLKAIGKLVSFIYNRCDLILAQSQSFIAEIGRYCRDPGRIVYFPSWAESVFEKRDVAPAAEVPLQPRSFDVMFAGNIGESQDFPSILAAAELVKPHSHIRWLLVGDGRMAAWVQEEIRRRGLERSVLMLGRHPVERMPSFYEHADALLLSLKDEPIFAMTIPGKLQSYLAAGIPVVAMLNGEGAAVVERARCGVTCRAGDAQGLAAAVLKLASLSDEQRAALGANAARVSASEFDRTQLITQLEAWLEQLRTAAARAQ